jgi:hypothetical protein
VITLISTPRPQRGIDEIGRNAMMKLAYQVLHRLPVIMIIAAIALYLISMFLPGLIYLKGSYHGDICIPDRGMAKMPGLGILISGWLGLLRGNIAWFANWFFIYACISSVKNLMPVAASRTIPVFSVRKRIALLSLSGSLIGLQAFSFQVWPNGDAGGVNCNLLDHLGSGFYLWELSFICLALSQMFK